MVDTTQTSAAMSRTELHSALRNEMEPQEIKKTLTAPPVGLWGDQEG
jgi:hypothetical protein